MITDRCATTCLICVLCFFYPSWLFLWQLLIALDIGSHWIQMYSSLLHGETSHKVTDLSANPIMRLYYSKVYYMEVIFTGHYLCYYTACALHILCWQRTLFRFLVYPVLHSRTTK